MAETLVRTVSVVALCALAFGCAYMVQDYLAGTPLSEFPIIAPVLTAIAVLSVASRVHESLKRHD